MEKEAWKLVNGYENLYWVSDQGNVRSKKKILSLPSDGWGYVVIRLYRNRQAKSIKVHRLVAKAFIPNPEEKPQVNHINGIKTDNRVQNLEWCTSSENVHHACKNGFNPKAKLNELQVSIIRRLKSDMPQREIANIFNINQKTVSRIQRGTSWGHLK